MTDMKELRKMLCDELDKIVKKGELSAGSLDIVDKLTHSIKSIDAIEAMKGSYSNDYSYRRDNRYSRDHMVSRLRSMMDDAPDEATRHEFRRFISKLEHDN